MNDLNSVFIVGKFQGYERKKKNEKFTDKLKDTFIDKKGPVSFYIKNNSYVYDEERKTYTENSIDVKVKMFLKKEGKLLKRGNRIGVNGRMGQDEDGLYVVAATISDLTKLEKK